MNAHFKPVDQTNSPVVALHSSASGSGQWKQLTTDIESRFALHAWDLPGYGKNPLAADHGQQGVAEYAMPVIRKIEQLGQPVHLVGHSMGGGVAMKIATMRPDLIKSLAVYEPVVFHVLRELGSEAILHLEQITQVAGLLTASLASDRPDVGMQQFLDFWNGDGFWNTLPSAAKARFASQALSVMNDFALAFAETWKLEDLQALEMPTLIMMGLDSPQVAQFMATRIARELPNARLAMLPELGHMAPAFNAEWVNPRIFEHLVGAERPSVYCSWSYRAAA